MYHHKSTQTVLQELAVDQATGLSRDGVQRQREIHGENRLRQKKKKTTLQRFFDQFKDRDDIWYATNMEIYQAWEDFQRLETSADGMRIYNPNLRSVWFATFAGKIYEVKPGETVTLE